MHMRLAVCVSREKERKREREKERKREGEEERRRDGESDKSGQQIDSCLINIYH